MLENEVCSLHVALTLKHYEVKQDSLFYWIENPLSSVDPVLVYKDHDLSLLDDDKLYANEYFDTQSSFSMYAKNLCSAFTVSELMEMLPARITLKKEEPFNSFTFMLTKQISKNIQYIVNYQCDCIMMQDPIMRSQLFEHNIYGEKLADVLAETRIKLIEEGFVKNN